MNWKRALLRLWLMASVLWIVALGIALWPRLYPTSDRFIDYAQGQIRADDPPRANCDAITLPAVRVDCYAFYRDKSKRRTVAAAILLAPPIMAFLVGWAVLRAVPGRARRRS